MLYCLPKQYNEFTSEIKLIERQRYPRGKIILSSKKYFTVKLNCLANNCNQSKKNAEIARSSIRDLL